jgi:hypothetical protein
MSDPIEVRDASSLLAHDKGTALQFVERLAGSRWFRLGEEARAES